MWTPRAAWRQGHPDLEAFTAYGRERAWNSLTLERNLYTIRLALSWIVNTADPVEVALYHASLAFGQRARFRSSWRAYIAFHHARGMQPCPAAPPVVGHGRPTSAMRRSLPDRPVAAIHALIRDRIPPLALAAMTWGDVVDSGGSGVRLRAVLDRASHVPGVDRTYAPLSTTGRVALEDLREWATGGRALNPTMPLIPMVPGSHIGASAGLLRQIAKEAK
jgi:hypothetical protein